LRNWFDDSPMWGTRKERERERSSRTLLLFLFPYSFSFSFSFSFCFFLHLFSGHFLIYSVSAFGIFICQTSCRMFPFEDLKVYKKAFQLNQKPYSLVKSNRIFASYIKNQLGRVGLSIMLNIAEGSAKYSSKDRRNYFITARGSVFVCCSIVSFLY
jgi:hypothetical protein